MAGLTSLLVLSLLLGAGAFGVAQLPLSFNFSRLRINQMSHFGTGLLLGAALGVILPEGIEEVASKAKAGEFPTSSIALSLIFGFAFMMLVEQVAANSHHHSSGRSNFGMGAFSPTNTISGDAELDIELNLAAEVARSPPSSLPITLGLVMHCFADGFALGAASMSSATASDPHAAELSLVVFFALLIHKAPAAIALTTSLLANGLPRPEIRKHVAIFAGSTPLGAIITYFVLEFLGLGEGQEWTGMALLFSAGTFLYVATVLRPVAFHSAPSPDEPPAAMRLGLVVSAMFIPYTISLLVEHDHGNGLPGGVQQVI